MSENKGLYGGRYRIGQKVGQGGVGAVFRAVQEPLGRHVALKILRPEYSRNPLVRRRFTREARAVAGLNHPNIATIFDFGVEADGTLFIAMEFIEGVPLSRVMRGGVQPRYLLAALDPILAALAHAHAKGVIHRDLKPDNILIAKVPGSEGRLPTVAELEVAPQWVKLVDFGIATVMGSDSEEAEDTRAGEVVGTPLYMSPEQARGERGLTPAVDLYTLGVVLFEGLSGHHPFAGYEPDETPMDIMIRHVAMSPPELHPPAGVYVPEALRSIVRRCLQKKPSGRYLSAAQLREALREARALLDAHAQLQAGDGAVRAKGPSDVALLDTDPDLVPTTVTPPIFAPRSSTANIYDGNPTIKLVEVHSSEMLAVDESSDEAGKTPVELFGDAIYRGAEVLVPDWSRFRSDIRSALRGVRFDVPLVGRDEERRALVEAVARCIHDGLGQVILLEGGTGIGKTKLATWLGEYVAERGKMRFVTGSFLREDGSGLRGLRDVLEGLFGVRQMGRAAVMVSITAQLRAWDLDDPRDAEALTAFLRPTDTTPPLGGMPQEALFALLVRVLERAGRERALLVLLDDVHWSGSVLGDFLEFLAVEFRYRPCNLMVLGTVRNEDLPGNPRMIESLRRLSRYSNETVLRLTIQKMGEAECDQLIETIMPADDNLKESIIQRSQGNPLHVVQLLQYLYQEELLGWDEDLKLFRVTGELDAINRVPPNLADLLLLRFEQIEERHEGNGRLLALLERCAVLGDRFAFEVVDDVLKREHNVQLSQVLERGIDVLLQESILTSVRGRGEDMLAFTHGLIREVLVENMTGLLQLRRLHRLAAAAKEAYYADKLEVVSQEIANHYLQAGDRRRALDFVLIAASAAQASYHLMDAIRLFAQASELALGLPGSDAPTRLKLTRRIADLREGFGQLHAAGQAYAELVRSTLFEGLTAEEEHATQEPSPEDMAPLTRPELNLLLEALH
ncbi:MAG: protein kinase, partial [Myxococcota bacterium]